MSRNDEDETDRRSILNSVDDGHNVFQDDSKPSAERRPMLKGLAVSIGSALGLGGTAAADPDGKGGELQRKTEAAMEGYETPADVNAALAEHATDLLTELSSSEFSGPITTEDFRAADVHVQKAPAEVNPAEGTYVTASEQEGVFTAHISIVRKTPTHVVRLNVQPQLDRSFATVTTKDGDAVAVLDPSVEGDLPTRVAESSDDDASIQKFCGGDGYTCPPGACCTFCGTKQVKHKRTCCQYPDGSVECNEEPVDQCCEPLVCC